MNEPNLEEDIKGEPEEILNLTDVFDNEEAPDGVDIDAVERNVTSTFQDYMQELLTQPKVKTEEEKESKMQARPDAHITSMQVDDLLRNDVLMGKFDAEKFNSMGEQFAAGPDDYSSPATAKRRKAPAKATSVKDTTPTAKGAKEKPKRATSNLRKLQNKLSQQRFRQRKRHAEAAQQGELDRMLNKIGALETAKTDLPKLQSENMKLQSSLEVKDKEIALLKKEIALVKKKKQEKGGSAGCNANDSFKEDQIKAKLLEVTTREYETMVSSLKEICTEYENGCPRDDDMVAQRRIAPVLSGFVDLTYHHSSKPTVKSLLAASLAYLGEQGISDDVKERLEDVVRTVNLSSAQETKIMASRTTFHKEMELLFTNRKELNKTIQKKFAESLSKGINNASAMSPDFVSDIDDLKENLLCECQLRQNFQVTLFRLLQPVQIMKVILGADPSFPDLVAFADVIATG